MSKKHLEMLNSVDPKRAIISEMFDLLRKEIGYLMGPITPKVLKKHPELADMSLQQRRGKAISQGSDLMLKLDKEEKYHPFTSSFCYVEIEGDHLVLKKDGVIVP